MKSDDLEQFRVSQLNSLRELKTDVSGETKAWYSASREVVTQAIGVFEIAIATYLTRGFEIGESRRSAQLIFGFPIIGLLIHENAPQVKDTPHTIRTWGTFPYNNEIFSDGETRFRALPMQGGDNAIDMILWEAALERVDKGRSDAPGRLDAAGGCLGRPHGRVDSSFRLPVKHSDKIRAIDDFLHSATNRYCFVDTPISLPSRYHITGIGLSLSDSPATGGGQSGSGIGLQYVADPSSAKEFRYDRDTVPRK